MTMTSHPVTDSPMINMHSARKQLGMGMPPDAMGCANSDAALVQELCSPAAKLTIVEVADWTVDLPISDKDILTTFGDTIDVWSTQNGKPPNGVAFASNTLATPGLVPSDMIIRGLSIRVLVEPETRLIKGNLVTVGSQTPAQIPAAFDVHDQNSLANNTLGLDLAHGQSALPGWIYYGLPTWRAAYAFMNAYNLIWSKNYQDLLIREPLTQSATIQPFAEAEAAGLAFTGDWDTVNQYNKRLQSLVGAPGYPALQQFEPITHERLGSYTVAGPLNIDDVTPTREQDASPSIFGGIGVPRGRHQIDPFIFASPVFWPAGHTMGIQFQARDPEYQKSFQRWLSLTGGTGGTPGTDLALPFAAAGVFAASGLAPSVVAANVATEITEDAAFTVATQQVPTIRSLNKFGRMRFEIGLIGLRVPQSWKAPVMKAIQAGAIQAPNGYGSLVGA